MMAITQEFKTKVRDALMKLRENFDGSDGAFAVKNKINHSYFSQMKSGKIDIGMADGKWIALARELDIATCNRKWNTARTAVFNQIEEDVKYCQEHSKAMIFVDDCGIGKTYTAKYLSRTLRNCFYLDASQSRTKIQFAKALAKTLGIEYRGKTGTVKEDIKYFLKVVEKPLIIIDEAGDLEYTAMLDLKEFWNATEGACGWYMIGADGLRAKIEKGISNKKVGYRELFSRFSSNYSFSVPIGKTEKIAFYKSLLTDVLKANMQDKSDLTTIVNKCIVTDNDGNIGGLRRAESILILHSN